MTIHTYKSEVYRGCRIYYRSFCKCFEYLAVIKGEIYTTHIKVIPTYVNKLLYAIGAEKTEYSQQQQKKILYSLRRLAETTIDFILDKDKKK